MMCVEMWVVSAHLPGQKYGFFNPFWARLEDGEISDLFSAVKEKRVIAQLPMKRLEKCVVAKNDSVFHLNQRNVLRVIKLIC